MRHSIMVHADTYFTILILKHRLEIEKQGCITIGEVVHIACRSLNMRSDLGSLCHG